MTSLVPARPPQWNSLAPTNNWMYIAKEILDESLRRFPPPNGLRPEFSYFTKPIRYKDSEAFQVFFGNWTVHWQLAWHGDEEYDEQGRYGDLSENVLVSLDVEAAGRKVPKIARMQRFVLDRVAETAQRALPDAEVRLVEHHLVWESVDFNPFDTDIVGNAAHRLVKYVTALAVPVLDATTEWAETEGLELQSMHPVLKAS